MKINFKLILALLALAIPLFFVFKTIFFGNINWGDAPHFSPHELNELFSEPETWTSRGIGLGGVNNFLWLSPLMFLYGSLHKFFGLSSDLILRLIFYIPSLVFSIFGAYVFSKGLGFSKIVSFFTVLFYVFNTYLILLIDGGQVGVALAYGLFPFSLYYLTNFVRRNDDKNFIKALIFTFLCGLADPRICIISFFTSFVWGVFEKKTKGLIGLLLVLSCWIALNLFWIYPLVVNFSLVTTSTSQNTLEWFNLFFVYSPHWPENLFGNTPKPPLYFIFLPVVSLVAVVLSKKARIIMALVVIVSLCALSTNLLVKLPFGFAFRDATKFFAPLTLFVGLLIGIFIDSLSKKIKILHTFFLAVALYVYILFLISPAIFSKMNFVLSNRTQSPELVQINNVLERDETFFRSVWVPERNPVTFEVKSKPAVDGFEVASFAPIKYLNASEDRYNFLNFPTFVNWLKILGIRYIVLSNNPRELFKTSSEQKDWNNINSLILQNKLLEKINYDGDLPLYKINNTFPRFYGVKNLVAVIGPNIFSKQSETITLNLEDGKIDPYLLEGISPDSVLLYYNQTKKSDLAMTFLQKYFLSTKDAKSNQWATFDHTEYLKYKYQLLIRDVQFEDFDYSKGISFSTIKSEKIQFIFDVKDPGAYVLASRSMIPDNNEKRLTWHYENLNLQKGKFVKYFDNQNNLTILNTVALIPQDEFEKAERLADTFSKHFKIIEEKDIQKTQINEVKVEETDSLKFTFDSQDNNWIIFSDSYNGLWKLRHNGEYFNSLSAFSTVNSFYVGGKQGVSTIEFEGQKNFRMGVYLSIISFLIIAIILLWLSSKPKKEV